MSPDQPSEIREVIRNVRDELNRFGNYALVILGTEVIGVISRDLSKPMEFQGSWWIIISIGAFVYFYFSRVVRCILELRFLSRHLKEVMKDKSALDDWHNYAERSRSRESILILPGWNLSVVYSYFILGLVVIMFAFIILMFPHKEFPL